MDTLICPMSHCRATNPPSADVCSNCGVPLHEYIHVTGHTAQLFNDGLKAARHGQFSQARDLFAAVVHWYPNDIEARNALAMTCLALNDVDEAHHQWKLVLKQSPTNSLAQQSLAKITPILGQKQSIKKPHTTIPSKFVCTKEHLRSYIPTYPSRRKKAFSTTSILNQLLSQILKLGWSIYIRLPF